MTAAFLDRFTVVTLRPNVYPRYCVPIVTRVMRITVNMGVTYGTNCPPTSTVQS